MALDLSWKRSTMHQLPMPKMLSIFPEIGVNFFARANLQQGRLHQVFRLSGAQAASPLSREPRGALSGAS
jgi:hypothetical protein